MRILMLSNLYPPQVHGGYELLAQDVVRLLARRGHEVEVLASGARASAPGPVTRTLRLARPFGQRAGRDRLRHLMVAALNRREVERYLAQRGRPDAVLAMSQRRLGLEPLRVLRRHGVPVVATVNDDWPVCYARPPRAGVRGRLFQLLAELVERGPLGSAAWGDLSVQRVVWLSDSIRTHVRGAGVQLPDGRVCSQGVDVERFVPGPPREPRQPLELLYVGRLHPGKAPEAALDALARLRARGIAARLRVAGEAVDAAYGQRLRQRARQAGVEALVTWLGQVPREQLPAVYHAADVFLFPCAWEGEGQGLTWQEAMACGVPVVAHPMGGARELLRADNCVLASECTGDGFAEGVAALVADPERRRALVRAGLRLVREHASLERYVDALEEELAAVCGAPAGARSDAEEARA